MTALWILGIVFVGTFVFTWFNRSYDYFRNYGKNSRGYAILAAIVWVLLLPVLIPASLATMFYKAQN